MARNKRGHTFLFENAVCITESAVTAGKNEAKGPYGKYFDRIIPDAKFGEKSFELAERKMLKSAVEDVMAKAGYIPKDIDVFVGGDLLNQIVSAAYTARDLEIPYLGIYGACSTMAESLMLSAILVDGGYASRVVAATGSHFASAERQYRFPLELGTPKPPTAQNTATAAGAVLVENGESEIRITRATIGKPVDFGVCDANNMGAAMAPAAVETVLTHLEDTGLEPDYYDLILTGDLGAHGSRLFVEMCEECGAKTADRHMDCGVMLFRGMEKINCGASGCGCSAAILAGYILDCMKRKELRRVLFAATGALMSPTIVQQGESMAGIAHAVSMEGRA